MGNLPESLTRPSHLGLKCPPSPTRIIQKRKTKEVTSIASPKLQPWIGNTNLLYHGQRTNHQSPIYQMRVPNLSKEEEENILIAGNHTASASLSLSLGIHSKDRKESSKRKRKGGSGKSASSSNGPFGTSTATSTAFGSWSSSSSRSPPSQLGTLHTTRQIRSLATTSKRASSQCSSPGLASASSNPSPMPKTSIDLSPRRHRGFISSNRVHHCLQPPSLSLSLTTFFLTSFSVSFINTRVESVDPLGQSKEKKTEVGLNATQPSRVSRLGLRPERVDPRVRVLNP